MLNPLLGENLGRWAEVYFTSSAETREQALRNLLLELQGEQPALEDGDFAEKKDLVPTPSAGEESSQPQSWSTVDFLRATNILAQRRDTWYSRLVNLPRRNYLFAASGFALAGVLVLGYTVFDGTPVPAPGAAAHLPATTVGAPVSKPLVPIATAVDTAKRTSSSRGQRPNPSGDAAKPAVSSAAELPPALQETSAHVAGSASAGSAPTIVSSENGSVELALAKSYLNGSDGKSRDSAEAAKWLWKAVGKQNAEATGLLSALYLKGDGVPKNCDQARLLLDAAARKGVKGASEQLGHLQAFGCQ